MKLSHLDERTLASLGAEASAMLVRRDYVGLASRFGYAVSLGREPSAAIEADYVKAAASPHEGQRGKVDVKFFHPNSTGLLALIECFVPVAPDAAVLLELVVTGQHEQHITIEDISGVAP